MKEFYNGVKVAVITSAWGQGGEGGSFKEGFIGRDCKECALSL